MALHFKLNPFPPRFYFTCSYADADLPRRAGFSWDKLARVWVTPFASVAKRVASDAQERGTVAMYKEKEEMRVLESAAVTDPFVPPTPGGKYFPYQRAGVKLLIERSRVLLADEPGLGKTIQFIGACNVLKPHRVLIVCPAAVKLNWLREWNRWTTLHLTVGVARGKHWPDTDVVIINYDILAKHYKKLHEKKWSMLCLDEAHMLANDTLRTRQVCGGGFGRPGEQPIDACKVAALTGTPFLNRPVELFNVLRYLDPATWQSKMAYAKRYCAAVHNGFGWDFNGASNLEELQYKLRSTVLIRRQKKDVMRDLPPKLRQLIEIEPESGTAKALARREAGIIKKTLARLGVGSVDELTPEQFKSVVQLMQSGAMVGFDEMSTMRRELGIEKVDFLISFLESAIAESGKVVCFAHHTEVVSRLREHFRGKCVVLTGVTAASQRQAVVDQFQNTDVPLFIGNIRAAGIGITLTAASRVVMAELDWTPGMMEQAEDRCHRIGAKAENVFIQYLVFAGSLDSVMAKTIVDKQENIERAVDFDSEAAIRGMTE